MKTHLKYYNLPRPHEVEDCRENRNVAQTLELFDATKLERFHHLLNSALYNEQSVAERLKLPHITAITLPSYPVYEERLRHHPGTLATLIKLFLLQSEVRQEESADALAPDLVDELIKVGILVETRTGMIIAAVSIYPCHGFHFVTDHQFWPIAHDYYEAPSQTVMHLGEDSYALAYLAPETRLGGRVLDLCTGSGVHAILAARRAGCAIGTDINPRAIAFARFNAALNGVAPRCDFRLGSLYEPIAQDLHSDEQFDLIIANEQFDLIIANPPFIPSPHLSPERLLERDAGPGGDEILGPVLQGLPAHLAP